MTRDDAVPAPTAVQLDAVFAILADAEPGDTPAQVRDDVDRLVEASGRGGRR